MDLADRPQRSVALAADPVAPAAPRHPLPINPAPGDARLLRRLRRIVRRRVRLDVAALGVGTATASDGAQAIYVETVSPRHPHLVAWRADRPVALVVLNDGCGARVVGVGGLDGRIELPSRLRTGAFLAFCYDDADAAA